jgi:hypothetical protein
MMRGKRMGEGTGGQQTPREAIMMAMAVERRRGRRRGG